MIGTDKANRLGVVPTHLRVPVTHCPGWPTEATEALWRKPHVARKIVGGPPTEVLVAHVLVDCQAHHLSLYRQAQIMSR